MPIEVKVRFRDSGWTWFLSDNDGLELWQGPRCVAEIGGRLLIQILAHYLMSAQLGRAMLEPPPLERLPPQPAPARSAPATPDAANREGWERARRASKCKT